MTDKRILVADQNGIHGRNRFLPPTFEVEVNYGEELSVLLAEANGIIRDDCSTSLSHFLDLPCRGRVTYGFEIVMFEREGLSVGEIQEAFSQAGLRVANLKELLAFVSKTNKVIGSSPLIALGSSTKLYLQIQEDDKSVWRKIWECLWRSTPRSLPVFPLIEEYGSKNILRFSTGECGWKSHCLFLGVCIELEKDRKLVDEPISMGEYLSLPDGSAFSGDYLKTVEFGFRFVARDGHICEVVEGKEMFQRQWASLDVPERGLRHYRPVFK
ncbi:MAG: hypothetical protein WCI52_01960 [bacterium]